MSLLPLNLYRDISFQGYDSIIWLVPLIMLSLITKIKLEQMAYEAMFATLYSVAVPTM
jgi:hypothetical protein